jgi:molecular chaperone GrpE
MAKENTKNKDVEVETENMAEANENEQEETVKVKAEKPSKKKARKAKKTAAELVEEEKIKYTELNDKYLRLFSEFDNFRKRTIKERMELTKTASQDVIMAMLPIIDDFERAIQAFDDTNEDQSLKEGVHLIYNKFKSTLNSKGVECMESKGKDFDTDFHEALTQIPAPSKDLKGKVIDVIEKGYTMNGKVIRFAKVVVGN